MFRATFIEFLIIGVLSLAFTYVLFGKLKSYAHKKTRVTGGAIEYGGALLGFVMVFGVLSAGYGRYVGSGEQTTIRIDGRYALTLYRADGETRQGNAIIRQMRGATFLDITGQVASVTTPPHVTFASTGASLNGHEIAFIYKNSRGEMGIGTGVIPEDRPASFTLNYYDVRGDTNLDLEGRMVFRRVR